MMNFRIVENNRDDINLYSRFKEMYLKPEEYSYMEIRKGLDLSTQRYKRLLEEVVDETGFRRNRRGMKGRKKNPPRKVKYYSLLRSGFYSVSKWKDNRKEYYFSSRDEEVVKKVVEKLIECDWDKAEMPRILDELGV